LSKIPAYSSLLELFKTPSFWHVSLHKWLKQKATAEQADFGLLNSNLSMHHHPACKVMRWVVSKPGFHTPHVCVLK